MLPIDVAKSMVDMFRTLQEFAHYQQPDVSHKERSLKRYTREQIERKSFTVRQCQKQIARLQQSIEAAQKLGHSVVVDMLREDIQIWVQAMKAATDAGRR